MLFNSYEFIFLYLPVVVVVYFYLGRKHSPIWASMWMVLVSLFFYGYWDWRYVPLLLSSILSVKKSNMLRRGDFGCIWGY